MNTSAASVEIPSKAKLLQATAIAIAVALVLLFTAVLPAEYGIDPLGTGKILGLNGLAESAPASRAAAAPAATGEATGPEFQAPVIKGVFVPQPKSYKIDSREIKLGDGEGIEIKYHMEKGAGMVYSWTVSPSEKIFFELHGEPDIKPDGAPEDYFESYEKDDQVGKDQSHGSFTAPTTGIHGWFWENQTGVPVTIKLVTSGYYDYILKNQDDVKTKLQPSDPK
jgi:hypothetical protein